MSIATMIGKPGTKVAIKRPTYAAGNTGYVAPTFAAHLSGVPAAIFPKAAGEPVFIGGKRHTITHVVFVAAGTDVETDDRIEFVDGTATRTIRIVGKREAGTFPISSHMAHTALDCEETEGVS